MCPCTLSWTRLSKAKSANPSRAVSHFPIDMFLAQLHLSRSMAEFHVNKPRHFEEGTCFHPKFLEHWGKLRGRQRLSCAFKLEAARQGAKSCPVVQIEIYRTGQASKLPEAPNTRHFVSPSTPQWAPNSSCPEAGSSYGPWLELVEVMKELLNSCTCIPYI